MKNLIAIAILGAGTLAFAQQPKPSSVPELDVTEQDSIRSLIAEQQAIRDHFAKVQAAVSQHHPGWKLDPNNPGVLVADPPPVSKKEVPVPTPETKK